MYHPDPIELQTQCGASHVWLLVRNRNGSWLWRRKQICDLCWIDAVNGGDEEDACATGTVQYTWFWTLIQHRIHTVQPLRRALKHWRSYRGNISRNCAGSRSSAVNAPHPADWWGPWRNLHLPPPSSDSVWTVSARWWGRPICSRTHCSIWWSAVWLT